MRQIYKQVINKDVEQICKYKNPFEENVSKLRKLVQERDPLDEEVRNSMQQKVLTACQTDRDEVLCASEATPLQMMHYILMLLEYQHTLGTEFQDFCEKNHDGKDRKKKLYTCQCEVRTAQKAVRAFFSRLCCSIEKGNQAVRIMGKHFFVRLEDVHTFEFVRELAKRRTYCLDKVASIMQNG